jgi:hypothetical protein
MTKNCKLRKAILSAFYNISQRFFYFATKICVGQSHFAKFSFRGKFSWVEMGFKIREVNYSENLRTLHPKSKNLTKSQLIKKSYWQQFLRNPIKFKYLNRELAWKYSSLIYFILKSSAKKKKGNISKNSAEKNPLNLGKKSQNPEKNCLDFLIPKIFVRFFRSNLPLVKINEVYSQYDILQFLSWIAIVVTDRESGRPRGFGFVTFQNEESAKKAITELDGTVCIFWISLFFKLVLQ